MPDSNSYKDYSWRNLSYHSFYQVVDAIVENIQSVVWKDTGKAKRRLKAFPKLYKLIIVQRGLKN